MKKIIAMTVLAAFLGFALPSYAQQDTGKHESTVKKAEHDVSKGAQKTAKGVKKGAKKAGNETAELATKGKATVTDKKSNEWVGPQGQTIYVDDGNKYYWVSEKGKRMWVSKEELKPKH
jgi:hypothetical protein